MNAEQRVLIIDSDLENCKRIKYALREYGLDAYYANSVVDGIDCLTRHGYQLVILDISVSEENGLQLLQVMRRMKDMPILVLSSQGDIEQKELAYHLGADDFMEKPVEPRECLLRAQSLLRRYNASTPLLKGQRRYTMVNFKDLFINPVTRRAYHEGHELDLTRREFDLLYLLASHDGQVFTHEQLRYHVWGDEYVGEENKAIPTSVSRLRQKLADKGYIETVRGVGYRFNKDGKE